MIQVVNVSKNYGNREVLNKINFTICNNLRVGLIGLNGTGKSTLMKIILKQEEPTSGSVVWVDEFLSYLPQVIEFDEDDTVFSFLNKEIKEEWEDYKIDKCLFDVGLEKIDKNLKVKLLSGGQKTKLGFARILMNDPTTLLLDEPTNNLDLDTLNWLEQFLKNFYGNVLVISHDRKFLDNVVNKVFELDFYSHKITEYTGGYSDYVEEKAKRIEKEIAVYNREQKKIKEMEEWIALKTQQLSFYQSPKVARQLQSYKKRFEKESSNAVEKKVESRKIKINDISDGVNASKMIFKVNTLKCRNLIYCKNIDCYGGDRIHLEGKNGCGKTTFLKILLKQIDDYTGEVVFGNNLKIGYFSQEHETLDNNMRIVDEFIANTNIKNEARARDVLGSFLFVGDKVFEKVKNLSQGEKVRLIIAELINQDNNFIFFDEPTNHLDIESREVLETAISAYKGGFLMISHDRYFIENIGINRKFEITNGSLINSPYKATGITYFDDSDYERRLKEEWGIKDESVDENIFIF